MDWDTAVIIILVAAGGAIGAVLRYSVGHLVDSSTFPWSTFVVNFIGCTLIALIFFAYGHAMPELVRYFLFIGIFGAFTTMSTFTLETVTLFSDGQLSTAFLNWFMNAGVCLFGAFAGRYIALLF
ncbi:MAG: CrcB family protein [Candidatus Cloacimonetes bacterium]|nr:CrcB family protein [Candidatus Cloacimonadota bacterium]